MNTVQFPAIPSKPYGCSICQHPEVYFYCTDQWTERLEFRGRIYLISQMEIKNYCKECFYEYGGSEEVYHV